GKLAGVSPHGGNRGAACLADRRTDNIEIRRYYRSSAAIICSYFFSYKYFRPNCRSGRCYAANEAVGASRRK
ncbi:MAG TPA: hypothetical protein PL017_05990, partial [Tenuifilaceae bacterium]|nr:hypothetical protein [Tenuifilaceae bacterium]